MARSATSGAPSPRGAPARNGSPTATFERLLSEYRKAFATYDFDRRSRIGLMNPAERSILERLLIDAREIQLRIHSPHLPAGKTHALLELAPFFNLNPRPAMHARRSGSMRTTEREGSMPPRNRH